MARNKAWSFYVPSKSRENKNHERKDRLGLKLVSKLKTIKGENDKV
jgi:hypothetical protein